MTYEKCTWYQHNILTNLFNRYQCNGMIDGIRLGQALDELGHPSTYNNLNLQIDEFILFIQGTFIPEKKKLLSLLALDHDKTKKTGCQSELLNKYTHELLTLEEFMNMSFKQVSDFMGWTGNILYDSPIEKSLIANGFISYGSSVLKKSFYLSDFTVGLSQVVQVRVRYLSTIVSTEHFTRQCNCLLYTSPSPRD